MIALNYDDITIIPEVITDIRSRSECNPYDEDGYLPIFASSMSSVSSIENSGDFNAARIRTVIPRSYSISDRLKYLKENEGNFVSFSLNEAEKLFVDRYEETLGYLCNDKTNEEDKKNKQFRICIDLANGHMSSLITICKKIKELNGDKIVIMTGNIANPKTYKNYDEVGIDYVRVSIGTGAACLTSSNVAIHYPVFSLLKEIYEIKQSINGKCKIVADGGIRGYRDIQKALIYADYVMIGGLFNKAMESAGKTTYGSSYFNIRGKKIYRPIKTIFTYGKEVPKEKYEETYQLIKDGKLTVWKEFYGQSSKIAQAIVASANTQTLKTLKTSEGLLKYQKVEYTLKKWAENETDYLRSAMSYTNSKTLEEYKDNQWTQITQIRYNN